MSYVEVFGKRGEKLAEIDDLAEEIRLTEAGQRMVKAPMSDGQGNVCKGDGKPVPAGRKMTDPGKPALFSAKHSDKGNGPGGSPNAKRRK